MSYPRYRDQIITISPDMDLKILPLIRSNPIRPLGLFNVEPSTQVFRQRSSAYSPRALKSQG